MKTHTCNPEEDCKVVPILSSLARPFLKIQNKKHWRCGSVRWPWVLSLHTHTGKDAHMQGCVSGFALGVASSRQPSHPFPGFIPSVLLHVLPRSRGQRELNSGRTEASPPSPGWPETHKRHSVLVEHVVPADSLLKGFHGKVWGREVRESLAQVDGIFVFIGQLDILYPGEK